MLQLLLVYFKMNLILLVGYFLSAFAWRIFAALGRNTTHRSRIGMNQFLIFISVVVPVLLHTVPKQSFPTTNWTVFQPAPESDEGRVRKGIRLPAVAQVQVVGASDRSTQADRWSPSLAAMDFASGAKIIGVGILAGMLAMVMRLFLNLRALRQLLSNSVLMRRLGRVRIVVSDQIRIPFSVRSLSTHWVVLPSAMLTQVKDLRIATHHELQHHRQHDTLWAVLVEWLVCFFFLNPAIYGLRREIIEFQEFSCDEALIGRKRISSHEYGSCLVRVAETALGFRQMHVGTTCMATVSKNSFKQKSFLRRRIEMFSSHRARESSRWTGVWAGTAIVLLTLTFALGAEQIQRAASDENGNTGKLVVDENIQAIAEATLADALQSERADRGFAIVADPASGKILAVANIDTKHKLTGYWSLAQRIAPVSFFKAVVVAQAIESGLTTPESTHACENGSYRFGGRVYHDHKEGGWDHLTTAETVAFSADICSIKIGQKIGEKGMEQMLVRYGFGPDGSAKGFPGARVGRIAFEGTALRPDLVAAVPTGFGIQATPIEMVQAFGAMANGGNLLKPRLANSPGDQGEVIRRVLTVENAAKMKDILRQVVTKGTAKGNAASNFYSTAGKTATSYMQDPLSGTSLGGPKRSNFAGFIGFAPVQNPRVEVYVGIYNPRDRDQALGSSHAAPVFRNIVEKVLKQMNVAPDLPRS